MQFAKNCATLAATVFCTLR